ncbi:MAG: transposase [Gammaproteobacteria bacterium]|nr:transposase [Gammaproteobacteria bacterium]
MTWLADLLAGFRWAATGVHAGCMAHLRRYLVEALDGGGEDVGVLLADIGALYGIEKQARERALDADARAALREADAQPILARLERRFEQVRRAVLPQSALGKAAAYALNHWSALGRYAQPGFGHVLIDNNSVERGIRPTKLGAKKLNLHRTPGCRLALGGDLLRHRGLSAARRESATPPHLGAAKARRRDHPHGRQPAAARLRCASDIELTRTASLTATSYPTNPSPAAASTCGRCDAYSVPTSSCVGGAVALCGRRRANPTLWSQAAVESPASRTCYGLATRSGCKADDEASI